MAYASDASVTTIAPPGRDARVDFFRGLALMFIFIDHVKENALQYVTMQNFGFADAAEVFVALAGYASFLAYTRVFDRQGWWAGLVKIASRISKLYLAHTLLRPAGWRRAIVAGLVGLIALVGPSRVHQGHHWFTDVTASYLLGIAYLIGLTGLYRRVKAARAGMRASRAAIQPPCASAKRRAAATSTCSGTVRTTAPVALETRNVMRRVAERRMSVTRKT